MTDADRCDLHGTPLIDFNLRPGEPICPDCESLLAGEADE